MRNSALATSKLTSKFQATIPGPVRKALKLQAGDWVGFEVVQSGAETSVRLRRATPLDLAFAQAVQGTLQEWSSAADDKAFADL